MSDELQLLAVIIAIYLADCLYWIPRDGVALTRSFGAWRLCWPSQIFGNDRGGVALANPLPPFGAVSRSLPSPISAGPEGVLSVAVPMLSVAMPRNEIEYFSWIEINSVERDETKVFINGKLFYRASSAHQAQALGHQIARIWRSAPDERSKAISEMLARSLDSKAVRDRWNHFCLATGRIAILTNFLFAFLFVGLPLLVWQFGLPRIIWPALAGLLAQTALLAFLFQRAHRELYPKNNSEILKPFLTMLLAPPAAIRARDFLCRPLFEGFHPLAVAEAFCPSTEIARIASICLRNLTYGPSRTERDEPINSAVKTEIWFRDQCRNRITEVIQNAGVALNELFLAPEKSDPSHSAYCPRCLQQFVSGAAICSDCGGLSLARF